ncbi:MAG: DegV family protein [Candidatus Heimdallarchaeota archaeon]|nr:DegV family protein [Candidatus Heimdallarchaeota archaeon]MCK4876609.1 DegV family protein [Candidatus Heimdallarchaeota archaeon]
MAHNFGIMTDSGAEFSLEYKKKHDLILIPTRIMIDDVEFIDRENITREEMIDKMINDKAKTSTSVAPPADFHRIIDDSLKKYDKVLYIAISSKMSATYQNAILTARKIDPDRFFAFDTQSVSWGMSLLIDHAILRRNQSIALEKVIEELNEMIKSLKLYFIVDTLEYLRRGGRIGAAKSMLGKLIGVKPILTIEDGEIKPEDTVKGLEAGFEFFESKLQEFTKDYTNYNFATIFGIETQEFKKFAEGLADKYKPLKFFYEPIGANIISHAGPFVFGIGIVEIPDDALMSYN